MTRRTLLSWGMLALACAVATPAYAGTYLSRAALLISSGMRELSYLRARFSDKELARVVQRLAEARRDTAAGMTVPKEVANAHPHLLLVLENHAMAAEAATQGEGEKFNVFYQRALDEERTFCAVLKQSGWTLPDAP